jgi:hypothetical protein
LLRPSRGTPWAVRTPRDGTAITFTKGSCEIDSSAMTFRASAGATWRDVIAMLDKAGFSPPVMQSNNDFGVGSDGRADASVSTRFHNEFAQNLPCGLLRLLAPSFEVASHEVASSSAPSDRASRFHALSPRFPLWFGEF